MGGGPAYLRTRRLPVLDAVTAHNSCTRDLVSPYLRINETSGLLGAIAPIARLSDILASRMNSP